MAAKKKAGGKARRTVLYSSAGKKLYAKRDASGRFEDIQSYQRAHAADLRRTSAAEAAAKAGARGGPAAKSSASRKPAAKSAARTAAKKR